MGKSQNIQAMAQSAVIEPFSLEKQKPKTPRLVARVQSATLFGIDAQPVQVEAQISSGLKRFCVVGLPDGVLRESKDRVRCAIENSGFKFPDQESIVSLAPAGLPKMGSGLELAIALAILEASRQVYVKNLRKRLIIGELSLDGSVRQAPGAFAATCFAHQTGIDEVIVPYNESSAVSIIEGIRVIGVRSLAEAAAYLQGKISINPCSVDTEKFAANTSPGFGEIIGQYQAKRALEISAAGAHNLLMVGPPGAGKSMLASRLPSILPPLMMKETIEVTKIHASQFNQTLGNQLNASSLLQHRPFRAPHHSISAAGLVGGGSPPVPGEVTLAHLGVLFLDELLEFNRNVLESLRQPLESRYVRISRARFSLVFPSNIMLLAAMNPCPCGMRGSGQGACQCSNAVLQRYQARLSGPLRDRFDMHIWIPRVDISQFAKPKTKDPTPEILNRVLKARSIQQDRYQSSITTNGTMPANRFKEICAISSKCQHLIEMADKQFQLSARSYTRLLRTARTIADLEMVQSIENVHLREALSYRSHWQSE